MVSIVYKISVVEIVVETVTITWVVSIFIHSVKDVEEEIVMVDFQNVI